MTRTSSCENSGTESDYTAPVTVPGKTRQKEKSSDARPD